MIDESKAYATTRVVEPPPQYGIRGALQVQSAMQIHKRAQFMRLFVVVSTLVLAVSNLAIPTLVASWLGTLTSSPAAYGISLFASCFTFALEISTRLQLGECLRASGLSWDAVNDASFG